MEVFRVGELKWTGLWGIRLFWLKNWFRFGGWDCCFWGWGWGMIWGWGWGWCWCWGWGWGWSWDWGWWDCMIGVGWFRWVFEIMFGIIDGIGLIGIELKWATWDTLCWGGGGTNEIFGGGCEWLWTAGWIWWSFDCTAYFECWIWLWFYFCYKELNEVLVEV